MAGKFSRHFLGWIVLFQTEIDKKIQCRKIERDKKYIASQLEGDFRVQMISIPPGIPPAAINNDRSLTHPFSLYHNSSTHSLEDADLCNSACLQCSLFGGSNIFHFCNRCHSHSPSRFGGDGEQNWKTRFVHVKMKFWISETPLRGFREPGEWGPKKPGSQEHDQTSPWSREQRKVF